MTNSSIIRRLTNSLTASLVLVGVLLVPLNSLSEAAAAAAASASATAVATSGEGNSAKQAIIFIPGDGGSQLEAKLNKTSRVHYICSLQSDWFDLWLNIHLLAPIEFDCLIDNMQLTYNTTSRRSQNNDGVQIRPTSYGSLESVTYLDIVRLPGTDYFEKIVGALEKEYQLGRNVDMFGAPYDFRRASNELGQFFENLTYQIEEQYVLHNYQPVTLICHSMGCLNSLYLLNSKPQAWRDVMVKRLVALAAPWQGSFKAISTMMFGDDLGIPLLFRFGRPKLQALQKTFPSLMYLFPREPTFDPNKVIVETPDANYTLKTLDKLFNMTKLLDQRDMLDDVKPSFEKLKAPNVELWCLYGNVANSTPTKLKLDKPYADFSYKEDLGPGDGTVNLESLRFCETFASQQEKPVYTREFAGLDHVDILKDAGVSDFIVSHIFNSSMEWNRVPARR